MYIVRPTYLLRKLYPKAIWRMPVNEKKIYLTFDDGPVPYITPWVLDLLKKENIRATFFCVGDNVSKNRNIYKRIVSENHSVGNHTYNHVNGWNTHGNQYFRNIIKCAELVDSKLFRPPYGKIKKSQLSLITKQYSVVMWDVLSGDYDKKTSPLQCLQNVIDNVRSGSVIVFHDSEKAQKNMEYALPKFIHYAKENGYEFDVLK